MAQVGLLPFARIALQVSRMVLPRFCPSNSLVTPFTIPPQSTAKASHARSVQRRRECQAGPRVYRRVKSLDTASHRAYHRVPNWDAISGSRW